MCVCVCVFEPPYTIVLTIELVNKVRLAEAFAHAIAYSDATIER